MFKKIVKFLLGFIGTVAALMLILIMSLAAWVMTGPKTLTKITPYVEAALNNKDAPYRVDVADTVLAWESWLSPIDFRLRGVTLLKPDGARLLSLNELSLKLDIPSLFRLKVVPHSIVLHSPRLNVFTDENDDFRIGFEGSSTGGVKIADIFGFIGASEAGGDTSALNSIQRVAIRHGRLTLGNSNEESMFVAPDANLEVSRQGKMLKANFAMDMKSEEGVSRLQVNADIKPGDEMIAAQAKLSRFSPHLLSKLFPNQPEWQALNMPLNGDASVSIDAEGNLSTLDFKVEGEEGVFNYPEHFAEAIPVKHALVEGQLRNNLTQLLLNQASFDFGGATLSLNGFGSETENGWVYDALAVAENMPVNDLYKYWPKTLGPTPYHWVTTHIREGVVPRAEARVSVTEAHLGQPFAEESLAVEIQAQGVSVNYLDGHPKVQDVKAIVRFTGKGMEITSQEGKMLTGGKLVDAWLAIPDLTVPTAPMSIRIALEAPAADVATYLAIPELAYSQPLGLDASTISGNTRGTLQFDFNLPDVDHPEADTNLRFLIEADVKDGAQPGFMHEGDLTNANGKLTITQDVLTYAGTMTLSEAPLNVELTHSFDEKLEYPTVYKATGNLTVPQLAAFGIDKLDFLEGALGLSAEVRRNPTASNTKAVVDAAQVAALIPEIGFLKMNGTPARVQVEVDKKGEAIDLKSIQLESKGMDLQLSAKTRDNFASVDAVDMQRVVFGSNDFSGTAQREGEGYKIRLKGKALDLTAYMDMDKELTPDQKAAKSGDFPFPMDVQAELGTLILGESRSMYGLNARFKCQVKFCESVDARGATSPDAPEQSAFNMKVASEGGKRTAIISAQNAGGFLKAMDFYDDMKGGVLTIQGEFNDADPQRPLVGTVAITEHTITNAPILAKMVSLLSLTGFANTITGQGISFNKMEGKLTYTKDYILIKDGKSIGSALGITIENGLLNRNSDAVQVNGTVVPSYTLNSALNKIPVIGEALSGGEGEGIFAATYKIEGTFPDKVEVSVNPLSMLAPGFLRNLFGSDAPEIPKPVEQERLPGEPRSEASPEATPQEATQEGSSEVAQPQIPTAAEPVSVE